MKPDKDWTKVMRSALRDAEATPPADGWARLERELNIPAPRTTVLRRYWPRIAAAAAAVLILVGVGDFLLQENRDLGDDGFVIASATDGGSSAADTLSRPAGTLGKSLREIVPTPDQLLAATLPGVDAQARRALPVQNGWGVRARHELADNDATLPDTAHPIDGAESTPGSGDSDQGKQPHSASALDSQHKANADTNKAASTRQYPAVSTYSEPKQWAYVPPRKPTSLSLFAGGGVTGSGTAATTPQSASIMMDVLEGNSPFDVSVAPVRYNYKDYSYRHHQPLSFGLSVRKELAYGLSLESGVTYTLLWSDVRLKTSSEDISQKLHFIGVPLRLNWQFLKTGNFSMYAGVGGMVEKCVAAKLGSKSFDEKGVQWSVLGAVGAQYSFGRYVGLYFEPEVSHYFTQTDLRTSRTDSNFNLTLRLGVRLSF